MTLAEFRASRGLTYKALADLLGKPMTTTFNWEKGRKNMRLHEAAAIVRATDGAVTFEDLLPSETVP